MPEQRTPRRSEYFVFQPITTRWMDNDIYGHVNNVTYYSYFDTAVNFYLIEKGGLNIQTAEVVGYVVDSRCSYRKPIAYPDRIEAGLRVEKLSQRSVQYGVAIFREGEEEACAFGHFVHVFVNRAQNVAVAIPEPIRSALERIQASTL